MSSRNLSPKPDPPSHAPQSRRILSGSPCRGMPHAFGLPCRPTRPPKTIHPDSDGRDSCTTVRCASSDVARPAPDRRRPRRPAPSPTATAGRLGNDRDAGTVVIVGVRELTHRRARCYLLGAASREVLQDRGPLRDDASGVGNGRQEVAERQEDSIRRLRWPSRRPRESGCGAALLCDGVDVAGGTPQGVRSGAGGKSLTISTGPWYRPRRSGGGT
jgi:hypothetical protein